MQTLSLSLQYPEQKYAVYTYRYFVWAASLLNYVSFMLVKSTRQVYSATEIRLALPARASSPQVLLVISRVLNRCGCGLE